jgi:hypothetical protein
MHGYSSSSDTDDEYSYRKNKGTVPATTTTTDANKKKKKRKLPPQQSINRIWKRFSNKRFNKALSVLPFDPVLPPTISERSNELLSAGYERAAEECRRKVKKIIQECRRVNMRYRDPGWDLVSFPVPVLVHAGSHCIWLQVGRMPLSAKGTAVSWRYPASCCFVRAVG